MYQKINSLSRSSVLIIAKRIYDDGSQAGSSVMSGCLWNNQSKSYIITNWHNVTGINPNTGENIGSFCPNQLEIRMKYSLPTGEKGLSEIMGAVREIDLYGAEHEKLWLEHPRGRNVDVVAVPITLGVPESAVVSYVNEQEYELSWSPDIGDDCFIIGHPEGFSGPLETPIWKRGSVASQPLLDYDDKPVFLLDTIGNRGLSGSPVIGKGTGIYDSKPGKKLSPNTIMGTWYNLVGIYAGRLSNSGIGSQLGRVWKRAVIDEIFESQNT